MHSLFYLGKHHYRFMTLRAICVSYKVAGSPDVLPAPKAFTEPFTRRFAGAMRHVHVDMLLG